MEREIASVWKVFLQTKNISGTLVTFSVSELLLCSTMLPSLLNSLQNKHHHATNKLEQVLKQLSDCYSLSAVIYYSSGLVPRQKEWMRTGGWQQWLNSKCHGVCLCSELPGGLLTALLQQAWTANSFAGLILPLLTLSSVLLQLCCY